MKKKPSFISCFITIHVILIFLQIHKHTLFVKNNYQSQQLEKRIVALTEQKQKFTQELYALKDRENIKKFARDTLRMGPYNLKQIKNLSNDTKL